MSSTTTPVMVRKPTEKEAIFFLTILSCMSNVSDIDWDLVANRAGYSNGNCAKTRFGQIKKAIGCKEDGSISAVSPPKPRGPRVKKAVGSGTNTKANKVTKRSPKKAKVVNDGIIETAMAETFNEQEDHEDDGMDENHQMAGFEVSADDHEGFDDGSAFYDVSDL